jgi:hypothetical protein
VTDRSPPSFAADILPLWRPGDVRAMERYFELSDYEQVKVHAELIHERLEDGSMPCDSMWPTERVALFRSWIDGGMPP